jgi:uncharacterized protein YbaA (DUF1428 family)
VACVQSFIVLEVGGAPLSDQSAPTRMVVGMMRLCVVSKSPRLDHTEYANAINACDSRVVVLSWAHAAFVLSHRQSGRNTGTGWSI